MRGGGKRGGWSGVVSTTLHVHVYTSYDKNPDGLNEVSAQNVVNLT